MIEVDAYAIGIVSILSILLIYQFVVCPRSKICMKK